MEKWKDIIGYEGYYQVSDAGNVRSLDRKIVKKNGDVQHRCGKSKPLRKNKDGYLFVKLSRDGIDRLHRVHTLVASAFLNRPSKNHEVNHKDFDRTNNHFENLEWVTHAENIAYTISAGRHASAKYGFSGSNNPNFGNRKLSQIYAEDLAYAKGSQSRPGAQNGRSRKIGIVTSSGVLHFDYIRECAKHISAHTPAAQSMNIDSLATKMRKCAESSTPCYGYNLRLFN
jgi:NUMOD4 motif./HNH endonuclease.